MNPDNQPSHNAAGTAAVRQRQQPDTASDEERAAKVAQLREQYQHGTYQVDAAELSAAIVDQHLER